MVLKTVTVWLLISIGDGNYGGRPTTTVERFATEQDCQALIIQIEAEQLKKNNKLKCLQATTVKRY